MSNFESIDKYPSELRIIVEGLLTIAERPVQLDYWQHWGFYESCLTFDDDISYFKHLARTREANLNFRQIKEIVRVFAMWRRFERIMDNENLPEDWTEKHLYMINHPYWTKIEQQAKLALSLIRVK